MSKNKIPSWTVYMLHIIYGHLLITYSTFIFYVIVEQNFFPLSLLLIYTLVHRLALKDFVLMYEVHEIIHVILKQCQIYRSKN